MAGWVERSSIPEAELIYEQRQVSSKRQPPDNIKKAPKKKSFEHTRALN